MKKKSVIYSLIMLLLVTVSCGPRRYKCGPYRKCENSIEKIQKDIINNEFVKIKDC
jgi:hypothetical protein